MSLILIEGFDDGLHAQRWTAASSPVTVAAGGRNGNYGLPSSQQVTRQCAAAEEHATMVFGGAMRIETYGGWSASAIRILGFMSDAGATEHLSMGVTSAGILHISRGATSLANSGIAVIAAATWYYVELKVTLHDSAGAYELRINGVPLLTASGVDTKNAGTKTVLDTLKISAVSGASSLRWDDMYWANGDGSGVTDFLGDVAVEGLLPSGDGDSSDFVGSDGNSTSNYQLVDDTSMTDYVEAGGVGDEDLYALADLVRTTGTVYGVQVAAMAQKTDGGTRDLAVEVKSGGVTDDGAAGVLTTTPDEFTSLWIADPATSAAWTVAGVNAAQAGVKVAT